MNFAVLSYKLRKKFLKEKIYQSYAEASANCSDKLYENKEIVHLVASKANNLVSNHKPINPGALAILELANKIYIQQPDTPITVIDFGGGDGDYYHTTRLLLSSFIKMKWIVVETPAMTAAMQANQTQELFFVSSLEKALEIANKVNIVFTSGTIQYTPDPQQTVTDLCKVQADYLVFNRQSLSEETFNIISIQSSPLSWHGSGSTLPDAFTEKIVRYPHTSLKRELFEQTLRTNNYHIVYTFAESTGIKKVNNLQISGISYVCKRNA
ncbi:MAG: methyltransferase, TIGR04325 family [Chitinophaga sp.]|uniref:methyltransferase, TIGR04325 family n=1 Tax=Chitinophaga sp. TaxID=1869181 RepID=UPI0025C6F5A3|nr:methyltransferase, TIGR04325 family [Chitinophaga sp.]MBV8255593.1 methyltransferase, TIGR04325 family [Chitinophaga sp.]